MYDFAVQQPKKMLANLDKWLKEAAELAEAKEFPPDRFLAFRLSPDMFDLARQIQAATDSAKFIAARVANVDPPKHADDETTLAALRERIASVIAFLDTVTEAQFEGTDDRRLELPFLQGKAVTARAYVREFGVPNFTFHVTMAYAILRHNGVGLGKRAYIGGLPLLD